MSGSIVPQLVRKDFHLTRRIILAFALITLSAAAMLPWLHGRIPDWVLINIGFMLLIGPAATCGIVVAMKTIVFEKEKSTQAFILSLPVSVRDFTHAKLLLNLPVFGVFWLVASAVGLYLAIGRGIFAGGAAPFISMVFVGVLLAYCCILATSLISQSLAKTVLAIFLFEVGTSAYLWTIAFYEPVARHVKGPAAVWDSASMSIIALQLLAAAAVIGAAVMFQRRRRDFI